MRVRALGLRTAASLARWALRPWARRFEADLARPAAAQQAALAEIVRDVARTEYGAHHRVRAGDGYDAFCAKLPVVTYEDLAPWIERQMRRERRALVATPVRFYAKTSGSSGPAKYVPYTDALVRSFTRLFRLWAHDLLADGPRLETAKTWLSISPHLGGGGMTERGVRIGARDDGEYLRVGTRIALAPFLALPPEVSRLRDADAFLHVAALHLLAESPEIVSVWNPSLLVVLLRYVAAHREEMARAWAAGRTEREGIEFRVTRPARSRLDVLQREPLEWSSLLPRLRLLSCWADAQAEAGAARLRRWFPGVTVQGKGLLATEAPMTLPLVRAGGCVPLVREVFFEFEDARGRVVRLHELTRGSVYSVLLTQRAGLCRYRIGDRVRVTHFHRETPCLVFVGRDGRVSDLVGEKLHEEFVRGALRTLALPDDGFCTLLPTRDADGPCHYVLLIDRLDGSAHDVARRLDAALQESPRYREARAVGQLAPPEVQVAPDAEARFLGHFAASGMRLGDVKHRALVTEPVDGAGLATWGGR